VNRYEHDRDNFDPAQAWQQFTQSNGLKLIIAGILGAMIVLGIASSAYTVQTEGQAVIKRFGKVVAIQDPGLHFKLPFGIDRAYFLPTRRILREEFGFRTVDPGQLTQYAKSAATTLESLMLTGDLNVIDVEWVVQYRIIDPDKFMHQVRNQRESIRDVSEAVMRRIVGNRLGSDVLTVGRVEVAAEARSEMQRILQDYNMGVSIENIELQDVTPPEPVKPAFNEVNEARQQRERLINEGEKYRNQIIPRAEGEASQIIAEAEAYRAERVNQARGAASRFTAIRQEYQNAPEVTRQRLFLEMIDQVLPKLGGIYVMDETTTSPLPLLQLHGTTATPHVQAK